MKIPPSVSEGFGGSSRPETVSRIIEFMVKEPQLVRDQHIVPQLHLKKFTDNDGWFWCYQRNRPVKRAHPKGECWSRDFYEYEVNGTKTHNQYERWLGGIENDAAPVLEALVNRRRLTDRERVTWAYYVATLFLRTRKVRFHFSERMARKFKEKIQSPEFVRSLQYDLLKGGDLVSSEDLRNWIENLSPNMDGSPSYFHLLLFRITSILVNAIIARSWDVLDAGHEKVFLISDCPVTTFEIAAGRVNPGPGFGTQNAIIFLPLTPKRAFVASPPETRWHAVGPPSAVDSANLWTVKFAHERVYANVNLPEIKRLVDLEIDSIVFGKDAFVASDRN